MGRYEEDQGSPAGPSHCPSHPALQEPTVGTGEGGFLSPKETIRGHIWNSWVST